MRTILFSLAGAFCLVATAHSQTSVHPRNEPTPSREALFAGIYLDMTPAEVTGSAAGSRRILVEESEESMVYRSNGIHLNATDRISFREGRVYAVSSRLSSPTGHQKGMEALITIGKPLMEKRAETVVSNGNRTVMTRTTADGRTIRVVWTQVSATEAIIEASVGLPDDERLLLK